MDHSTGYFQSNPAALQTIFHASDDIARLLGTTDGQQPTRRFHHEPSLCPLKSTQMHALVVDGRCRGTGYADAPAIGSRYILDRSCSSGRAVRWPGAGRISAKFRPPCSCRRPRKTFGDVAQPPFLLPRGGFKQQLAPLLLSERKASAHIQCRIVQGRVITSPGLAHGWIRDQPTSPQPTSPLAIRVGRMQTVRRKNADRGKQ